MSTIQNHTQPLLINELERVKALADFDPDYTELKGTFDNLTALAAKISGTHISLVNLIDSFTQWSVSNYGIDADQFPREESLCQYTIAGEDYFEISDLSLDERSKDSFYVHNPLNLRYYFGIPLKTQHGYTIGSLCVLDTIAKKLSSDKIELLKLLAIEVVDKLTNLKILQKCNIELEEAKNRQRKLAHDIRGPLSGISGIIDIIRKRGDKNKLADVMDYVFMINKSNYSVLELAEEILNKEKKGNSNFFTLTVFKDKLDSLYTPQAKAKNISFRVSIGVSNQSLSFSKERLLQITGNLISNAVKFSPEYGTVTVKLDLLISNKEKLLKINVSDNGRGLSQGAINKILEGEQESSEGTIGEIGYGFGLPMVIGDITSLNGDLQITSEQGWGTNFEITIPMS